MSKNLGPVGISGSMGTSGPSGYGINEVKRKYMNRFNIDAFLEPDNFMPLYKIIDNITGVEYKLRPTSMITIIEELENYLNELIINIRNEKINNIIE
jgi:hypothetical protein